MVGGGKMIDRFPMYGFHITKVKANDQQAAMSRDSTKGSAGDLSTTSVC
jgi:hypothetical protein